jgi:hypothetical protein
MGIVLKTVVGIARGLNGVFNYRSCEICTTGILGLLAMALMNSK